MINSLHPDDADITESTTIRANRKMSLPGWLKSERVVLLVLLTLTILIWLPRFKGPIDLRWDGGVYYILGTSLAEGKGYRLLNEPGEIEAVQYPPLLPLIIASYQLILGTDDPTTVGRWLRFSAFIIFVLYIYIIFKFFESYLSLNWAFLATTICLFSMHICFLSDLCFPELLFSIFTILFVLSLGKQSSHANSILVYFLAVASYALRTIGLVALAVWILDSLLRKKFKQALLRGVFALIPIFCWQFYIVSVESSYEYNHPQYAYQRAPYLFYNVSYSRNVTFVDPFAPEKGATNTVGIMRRFASNAVYIPSNFGETVTALRAYWENWFEYLLLDIKGKTFVTYWGTFLILYCIGFFVIIGLILQLLQQHRRIISLYTFAYVAVVCLTPFPQQYARYLMPIIPFLVLSLMVFLLFARNTSERFLLSKWSSFGKYLGATTLFVVLFTELLWFFTVYTVDHQQISYLDRNKQFINYRLFYYVKTEQDFDSCVSYLQQNAKPADVIAAGTPHWIFLRTGLKAVMPPFENDTTQAQQLLDSVPVRYLIIGQDVVKSERYTLQMVQQFPEQWKQVYSVPESSWAVYQRVNH
jgi:hypothetical protein